MSIPVFWMAEKFARGRYNSTNMFNDMLDRYDCTHTHFDVTYEPNPVASLEGCVAVLHGGRMLDVPPEHISEKLSHLRWVLLVALGDEECAYQVERIKHPNMITWIQEPMPGRHDFAKRRMINGYPHYAKEHIENIRGSFVRCERDLDWVFHGQVTHKRRFDCVDAMLKIPWGGIIVCTKGFTQGVSQEEYFRLYCRAKWAPCPSGPFSPDTARVWESLLCGCVPILDDLSPNRPTPGFWAYVLGDDHPFPVLTSWELLPAMMVHWETFRSACWKWWEHYLDRYMNHWLLEDLASLGVRV